MKYRQDLQVRLQERYRRLYKANINNANEQFQYFLAWIDAEPELHALVESIDRACPDFDSAAWYKTEGEQSRRGAFRLPPKEAEMAKLVLWIVRRIATGEFSAVDVAWTFSSERNGNDALREFTTSHVEQLVEYLNERLIVGSDMLHLLERYARRVKWFEKERLRSEYDGDTRRGEKSLEKDLRRFLFDQGVDYPFTQAASPSGQADVLAGLDSDDPLTCEVKLFDDDRYNVAYLAKGLNQAVRYAEDYGKTEAQLVIFNLSSRSLQLPTDGELKSWPPRLHVANITVFLVVVDIGARPSASKAGSAEPLAISRGDLVLE